MIDWVVSPLDQTFPEAIEDVNTTDSPAQKVVDPDGVIVGVIGVVTVTTTGALVAEQPFPLV